VDEQAFRAVYDATAKPLSRYIVRVCGKQDVADDLLQRARREAQVLLESRGTDHA